jgi:hypothetical protein
VDPSTAESALAIPSCFRGAGKGSVGGCGEREGELGIAQRTPWVGLGFGMSEAVLYSFSVWQSGAWEVLLARLILTVPMHAIATTIFAYCYARGWGWLGLGVAVIMHSLFNARVG